jgi:hypothetical protein
MQCDKTVKESPAPRDSGSDTNFIEHTHNRLDGKFENFSTRKGQVDPVGKAIILLLDAVKTELCSVWQPKPATRK